MYSSNFIANSDYLIKYLLPKYVCKDEVDSRKIVYDLADNVVDIKDVQCEFPRISNQVINIGKFPLDTMLSMISNVRLSRRPVSVIRSELFQTNTKQEYINHEATNFMIISKPGIENYELAEKLKNHFKCVHIDCDQLVEREIQSKSRLGVWLDKNLQLNKILPIEIILWLIQRETMTNKALYCGYILTGLPMIPRTDLNVKKNFLTEEDFLMFQQIVDEIIDTPITIRTRELAKLKKQLFIEYPQLDDDDDDVKEDIATEQPKSPGTSPIPRLFHRITCDRDVRFSIERQLFFSLDLENQPTILIYVDCDDEDIITKNILFNKKTPEELEGIRVALNRYNIALDIVQQFICHFPQTNLIYCNGLYTTDEIFQCCYNKILDSCSFRHVFLPTDFYDTFKDDESIIEKLDAEPNKNEVLTLLLKIKPVREDLGWFRSSYENKCPVMMTRGKCVSGKYQHSAQFVGHIYMLSSDENKRIFLESPKLFTQAQPTCRVCIMGPRYSGKTTFARCLKKFFDNCAIIDVNFLFDYYKRTEITNRYYAEACEEAIEKLGAESLDKYNEEVKIQEQKQHEWLTEMTKNITRFLKLIPPKPGKNKKPTQSKKAMKEREKLKILLNEFGFETDNPVYLKTYLISKDLLMMRLPLDLRKQILYREPKADDVDVMKLAKERMNELSKDYIMPLARKLEIIVTKIRLCEKRQKILTKQMKLYGNWILDGLPPDIELFQGLQEMSCLPDVIIYMDDSVGERLAENQNIKCHRDFQDTNYVVRTVVNCNKLFYKNMIIPSTNEHEETKFFGAQVVRRELEHILMQESLDGIDDFIEENENYRQSFEQIKAFLELSDTHIVSVDIHNASWTNAIIKGLKHYMNYFNAHPHVLVDDWSNDEMKSTDRIQRIGTTAEYCPVLFVDKMLLKLGHSQYSVQLKNRTYLLSTEEALQTFLNDPFKYSDIERPFRIPPYRLCVIGNYHITKRNDLRRVADVIGARFFPMDQLINFHYEKIQSNRVLNVSTYYEVLEDLGDRLVTDIVAPLFNDGFLLENFPITADHLQQMVDLNMCPEQIFYLKLENEHLLKDELKFYMENYKGVLLKKINDYKVENRNWNEQRKLRFIELMNELPDDFGEEEEEEESFEDRLELDNLIEILEKFNIDVCSNRERQIKQLHIADMVNQEMPPDRYTKIIDELMMFPMKQEVEHFLQNRLAEYEKIKAVAEENFIPFIQIRLHPYTKKETEKSVLKHIKESTDRQYIFERSHPISFQNALDYLHHGQFMLSRYFWNCPVRNLDMNYPMKLSVRTPDLDQRLQPFIHNEHIYFVQRQYHNVDNFFARPYKYTTPLNSCKITRPIRLAVHGPGDGGSTILCQRIKKEFQLNTFTLDGMIEYVMKNFKWTKIAGQLIQSGLKITDNQQICDLVKISVNFETLGWILHDIPLNPDLVKCFILNSLPISLVIYLDPTGTDLWTNFKSNYNSQKYKQKMEVIEKLYDMVEHLREFSTHCNNFKDLNQNVITIKDFTSTWITWNKAYREIVLLLRLLNIYELRGIELASGSLYKLDVTEYELNFRLSPLKLYCPLCWLQHKLLIKYKYQYIDDEAEQPIYSENLYEKNLFQYRKHFYWSCNSHLVELMVNAQTYLPTDQSLPDEIPKLIKEWKEYVITNQGYCPVAYLKSKKADVVIGLPEYSVLYFKKIYVMSSEKCCLKFLKNPDKYKDVQIVFVYSQRSDGGNEDFKNMELDFGSVTPTLITNALLDCAFDRPKHYSLDPSQSLEIYLGLYFKCHNANSSEAYTAIHKSLFLKFWEECKLVQRCINEMQITGNPYILRKKMPIIRASSMSAFGF